ncbi:hypothetical protein CDAR_12861 [Caerostris darwini]|uniref:Uncharacterized protein n=1 Tax=Caerostris darwini TaxID=1538125 RepID=A0AAV4TNE4_9ARAC|nr:hypothetical protein CDAR_12861 [Caerostris darwini]
MTKRTVKQTRYLCCSKQFSRGKKMRQGASLPADKNRGWVNEVSQTIFRIVRCRKIPSRETESFRFRTQGGILSQLATIKRRTRRWGGGQGWEKCRSKTQRETTIMLR